MLQNFPIVTKFGALDWLIVAVFLAGLKREGRNEPERHPEAAAALKSLRRWRGVLEGHQQPASDNPE